MTEARGICPVCDKDITVMDGSIKRAVMHMAQTAGKALIACPNCCHVLYLDKIPTTGDADLMAWIALYDTKEAKSWLPCIPLLDPMDAKMPNGFVEHLNVRYWTPGDDTEAIPAINYMIKYGIEPALAWAMMGHR
jgi:hypothetical protein